MRPSLGSQIRCQLDANYPKSLTAVQLAEYLGANTKCIRTTLWRLVKLSSIQQPERGQYRALGYMDKYLERPAWKR